MTVCSATSYRAVLAWQFRIPAGFFPHFVHSKKLCSNAGRRKYIAALRAPVVVNLEAIITDWFREIPLSCEEKISLTPNTSFLSCVAYSCRARGL